MRMKQDDHVCTHEVLQSPLLRNPAISLRHNVFADTQPLDSLVLPDLNDQRSAHCACVTKTAVHMVLSNIRRCTKATWLVEGQPRTRHQCALEIGPQRTRTHTAMFPQTMAVSG
jgi:hypothetical protein